MTGPEDTTPVVDSDSEWLSGLIDAVEAAEEPWDKTTAAVVRIEARVKFGLMGPALRERTRSYVKAAKVMSARGFDDLTRTRPGRETSAAAGEPEDVPLQAGDVRPFTLAEVEDVHKRWLHDPDPVHTRATLAAYVANYKLEGDPVWLVLVGGSGWGKTERIMSQARMPGIVLASGINSPAALLSATPESERAPDAHGGILRLVGDNGVMIMKDFTSILAMDYKERGKVLAALREIHDGRWDRLMGTEGGRTLTWSGKCGLLTGCTSVIDRAYGVQAEMGQRWLYLRLPATDRPATALSALSQNGAEAKMRHELEEATTGLLHHLPGQPHPVGPVQERLVALASLASLGRSPTHRDYRGDLESIDDPEAPTRMIKQLAQLWRACGMLGLDQAASWELIHRCAIDSMPALRGRALRFLAEPGNVRSRTSVITRALGHPRRSVYRALEDLEAHGVVDHVDLYPKNVEPPEVTDGEPDPAEERKRRRWQEWTLSPVAAAWIAAMDGDDWF